MRRFVVRSLAAVCGGVAAVALALAPAAAQAPESLRIAILSDLNGVVADLSGPGSVLSARMAIEDFGGSVLGRPIVLLEGDHQNKPDVGLQIARGWYDGGVRAIFDVGITTVALAVQALAKEKNRLVVFNSSASADLTGIHCSPTGIHWTYNNYAQALGVVRQLFDEGRKDWYFLTVDFAYGKNVQRDTTAMIEARGGRVLGASLHPFETMDFSSYLLRAQSSGAKVIGLATSSVLAANALKQGEEFGLRQSGQILAPLSLVLNDVKGLGLPVAQGLITTEAFYWDQDDGTRAFAKRYFDRFKRMPNMIQASLYGAVTHYLKAVAKAGTDDTARVAETMKATPVDDFMTRAGTIRPDGRVMRDMYVFRVKTPVESKGDWDLYSPVATIPRDEAFAPADPKACPLVKG